MTMGVKSNPPQIRVICDEYVSSERHPAKTLDLLQQFVSEDGNTYWNAMPVMPGAVSGKLSVRRNDQGGLEAVTQGAHSKLRASGEVWVNGETGERRHGPYEKIPPATKSMQSMFQIITRQLGVHPDEFDVSVSVLYEWKCHSCGFAVNLRAEKVWPILDQIHGLGIGEVTLAQMRAAADRLPEN